MAVIGKIRSQSGLLIAVIGIAMGLFVLGDLLGTGSGLVNQAETDVAEIRGNMVSYVEFEGKVQKEIGTQTFDDQATEQVRNRVWNMLLQENIMYKEYNELGLSVSPEELYNQIKNSGPNSIMSQYFTDPQTGQIYDQFRDQATGGINSQQVLNYIRQVLDGDNAEAWLPVEQAIKMDRLSAKYYNLIKKGLSPSSFEVSEEVAARGKRVNFNYVAKYYSSIADDEVEVTDADLKKYYTKHKDEDKYQQKETTRGIEYIEYAVVPSAEDVNLMLEDFNDLKVEFIEAENDTTFVNDNADTPFNVRYFRKGQLPTSVDSVLYFATNDTVLGPVEDAGFYNLYKKLGSKVSSDSVNARHILIQIANDDSASAKSRVDSIKSVILAQNNFELMAAQFSVDQGSAKNGGSLDWFTEGRMVKPFNDACFNGVAGDMVIVRSQFGYHLIEILEKTKEVEKTLIAIVNRELRPGKDTYDKAYNDASAFSINNNTQELFKTTGASLNIQQAAYIKENDKNLNTIDSPRPIIRWVYSAERGSVSDPFELDNRFIVACLTNIREEGLLPFEEVKEQMRAEVLNEKKAEKAMELVKGAADLNAVASAWEEQIQNVGDLQFSSFSIAGIGPEGNVLGSVFSLEPNEVSAPIQGDRGVFVLQVTKYTDQASATNEQVLADLERGYQGRVDFEVFNALKEHAKIVDNRAKFY